MKRTGTELKNKMSRQERREARLRQEKLRLQKKSKLTLIVYAVIRLIEPALISCICLLFPAIVRCYLKAP